MAWHWLVKEFLTKAVKYDPDSNNCGMYLFNLRRGEGMKETLCPRCGESVVFVDYGDNPAFLTGECQACHLKGEYLEGQGFTWQALNDRELRLERAKRALRKAIAREPLLFNPSSSFLNAYKDGLEALEGIK